MGRKQAEFLTPNAGQQDAASKETPVYPSPANPPETTVT